MPRPQRPSRTRTGALPEYLWRWLLDQEFEGDPRGDDALEIFLLDGPDGTRLAQIWENVGDAVIATFAAAYPGRRPRIFWRLSAPEPRRQIGGRGTFTSELYTALSRPLEYGIRSDSAILLTAYDPDDPPSFESQATFLKRHRLLLSSEARRLRPADFEPETIAIRTETDDSDGSREQPTAN